MRAPALRRPLLLPLAAGLLVLACGDDSSVTVTSPAPATPPAALAAETGREDQLPSGFPDDVPLYGGARPLSSVSAPEHGTIVNLRSADPPEQVFAWYRAHYAAQGWEIEKELAERGRHTVVARKGNRVSSVVVQAVPGATQALLAVAEDR